jgi:hypothetical protein
MHLENHHRIEQRPAIIGPVRIGQSLLQIRPELFEIHRTVKRLNLISKPAQSRNRQISGCLGLARSTVAQLLEWAAPAGFTWPRSGRS